MLQISAKLLDWYDHNARRLPWRSDSSPYKVWISEIMLQQTQVETVIPFFERFLERFPDLTSLALADVSEVLRLWEGLGYYSRARNLLKTARVIKTEHAGKFPTSADALRRLPGIGDYTAGAIASIAFGQPEPALDGNIRRVFLRILDLHEPPCKQTDAQLLHFARLHLPPSRPGDFNQALMDLGSAICTPAKPACQHCPLQSDCLALQRGTQQLLPARKPKAEVPHRLVVAAVILLKGQALLRLRPSKGMLGGLWEFPGGAALPESPDLPQALQVICASRFGLPIEVNALQKVYRHAYTHFRITLYAFRCQLQQPVSEGLPSGLAWVPAANLTSYPMGKVARLISRELQQELNLNQ